jgi:hypothetical protein
MKIITSTIITLFILFTASVALAVPSPFEDLSGFASGLLTGIHDSNWRVVGAFIIIGLVALVRKIGPEKLSSGKAAWVTAIVLGALGGLGNALPNLSFAGALDSLVNGAITGLVASGLYSGVKKLGEENKENVLE